MKWLKLISLHLVRRSECSELSESKQCSLFPEPLFFWVYGLLDDLVDGDELVSRAGSVDRLLVLGRDL